jgi:D-glycero-D-manno-heptose 1,7-bisphosphate phosphatase
MTRKLVILDRDGVINVPAQNNDYVYRVEDFKLYGDVGIFFEELLKYDKKIAIATNQRGIARNLYTAEDVELLHEHMLSICNLTHDDISLFYCPHEIDTCECRKPKPGLLISALSILGFEKDQAIFIGDKASDRQAAESAGIEFINLNRDSLPTTKSEMKSLIECLPLILGLSHE